MDGMAGDLHEVMPLTARKSRIPSDCGICIGEKRLFSKVKCGGLSFWLDF
jgi:hypothetical protein